MVGKSEESTLELRKVYKWLMLFADRVIVNKDYLNQLDTAIGDGDHGSNLSRGMLAFREQITDDLATDSAGLLQQLGMTLISNVGGASGPLYGTAFIKMSKATKAQSEISEILASGLEGIKLLGGAKKSEKTMVDEWEPVVEALQAGHLSNDIITSSLAATKDMRAYKGRASYLGNRSRGHLDPGAQSSAYLFESLLEAGVLDE